LEKKKNPFYHKRVSADFFSKSWSAYETRYYSMYLRCRPCHLRQSILKNYISYETTKGPSFLLFRRWCTPRRTLFLDPFIYTFLYCALLSSREIRVQTNPAAIAECSKTGIAIIIIIIKKRANICPLTYSSSTLHADVAADDDDGDFLKRFNRSLALRKANG